ALQKLPEICRLELGSRQAGEVREFTNQATQGTNFVLDDLQAGVQQLLVLGIALRIAPMDLLHSELNGREGVFDFVGQTPRHLLPGTNALQVLDARATGLDLCEHLVESPSKVTNLIAAPL